MKKILIMTFFLLPSFIPTLPAQENDILDINIIQAETVKEVNFIKMLEERFWINGSFFLAPETFISQERITLKKFNLSYDHEIEGPNKIETWKNNPSDDTQNCWIKMVRDDAEAYQEGRCLEVKYDVESRLDAANGFWIDLNKMDLTHFTHLSFWIKGNDRIGFPKMIGIGLADSEGNIEVHHFDSFTTDWQKFLLDISQKSKSFKWNEISRLYFIIKSSLANQLKGIFYLDNIEFVRGRVFE